jgi:hypothetical protein
MGRKSSRKSRSPSFESLEKRALMSTSVIYVDASIAAHSASVIHDGSSWAKAYPDLQSALTKAA